MNDINDYIISGGQAGKSRLNVLSDVLHDHTRTLLEGQGLTAGSSFLDAGCGGGNVAMMVAEIVGGKGRVAGTDFDEEIVALAQQDALAAGLHNISFRQMSAYDMDYNGEFDMAYARFLLSHLQRPMDVIKKMRESVKPGGKIIVEDVDFSGHFCYPACLAFDRYVECYTAAAQSKGENANVGTSLFSLFREAGIKETGFDVIQPCFNAGPGKWMAYKTLENIKSALVAQDIVSPQIVDAMLRELEAFTKDEQTVISLPRIFRVWGVRGA